MGWGKIRKLSLTKKILIGSLILVFMIGAAFAVSVGQVYTIKMFGINLASSRDIEPVISSYYLQNDERWSGDNVGNTDRKMGSIGCLVTSIATSVNHLGYPITPKELNSKLADAGAYQGADVIWYKIADAIPGIDYKYSKIFDRNTIENDLNKGLLPIVNVKYYKSGVSHWVLIVGAKNGEFLICDPLSDGKTLMPLSEHGKVYAYRVMVNTNQMG